MRARLALLLPLLLLAACANGKWVELEGHRYQVEIANQEASRQRGLMFRDSMEPDHGMLFIHDYEAPQAYWMKNCRIPLDILYFNHDLKLVTAQTDVPPCSAGNQCPPYPSKAPALYVLELNAGQAAKVGAKDGSVLKVGPGIELKAASN
ncbi:MAG: DUF192 domain-containing protein [Pseudoxanthomonas sp.]